MKMRRLRKWRQSWAIKKIKKVPVIKNGVLMGIISRGAIIRFITKEFIVLKEFLSRKMLKEILFQ